ncbi:MAG: class I adenylate-forming enzyme family protein [Acidimicrobiia bacterium]
MDRSVSSDASAAAFLAEHGLVCASPRAIPGVPESVASLVDVAADLHGDAPALADRRARFTYAELREAVDRAADVLAGSGVRPYDRVAMSLPNTVDVVVGFLAVMRLGAIWVGINTHLAAPEQRFLLDDSGASFLVTTAATAASLDSPAAQPDTVVLLVDVERPGSWWAAGSADRRGIDHVDPHGPAAIAYTSGTTGRPKGAVHSQHNILLSPAAITRLEPGPLVQGTILPLTILNMQVLSTIQSMLCGGLLVPIDRIDAVGVAGWVREFAVQRMYTTPPTVYDLLTRPDIEPGDVATLTHLGVGGAKVPAGLRERYRERFGRDFVVGYGLTEAPTGVTGASLAVRSNPVGSSGVAREHVDVTVRDAAGAALGPDVEGEICVGPRSDGPYAGCYSTMLGYWNRPDATAAVLRGGVLHTGDVGRIDADGVLWVLDRHSDLIIRGGANVYPAEVERVVELLPQIAEIAVVPREHPRLGEEVVAFVSPAPDVDAGDLDREQLAAVCASQLARYKVPAAWFAVERFPRNAMGKVIKPVLTQWLSDGAWPDGLAAPVTL